MTNPGPSIQAGSIASAQKPLSASSGYDDRLTKRCATPTGGRNIEHYRQIAEALLAVETVSITIGIPLPAPTSRVRARRNAVTDLPMRFVRLSLSTVSTESLRSYYEDLESLPDDSESGMVLGINQITLVERYLWAIITAVLMGLLAWGTFRTLASGLPGSLSAGVAATLVSMMLFVGLSSEAYRRASFAKVLLIEIRRRSGSFPDRPGAISVRPIGPKPLSD